MNKKISERIKCDNCPPYKSPSMSINYVKGVYHCFRCGKAGRLKQKLFFNHPDMGSAYSAPVLPPEYVPLDPYSPYNLKHKFALRYLRDRRISNEQILKYKMGFCSTGKFENRVIIPFWEGSELIYYVARSIRPNEPRKYLNPPTPKGDFLFRTFLGKVGMAVIVEGVFDALSVERVAPAIALLGKKPTQEQVNSIPSYTDRAILMLDSDAHKDAIYLHDSLSYHIPTFKVFLKTGDPGSASKEILNELIS